MTPERGFRRLTIVVSLLIIGLGITFDSINLQPHATVQVTVRDGRKFTLERHEPKDLLMDHRSLSDALKAKAEDPTRRSDSVRRWTVTAPDGSKRTVEAVTRDEAIKIVRDAYEHPDPRYRGWIAVSELEVHGIADARAVRGPEYWWWADTVWLKVAAVLVGILWTVFFVVRWIVRGFTG